MERENTKNRYEVGDIVYAKVDTTTKLMVRRYLDRIYYCTMAEDSSQKEQVYFERELKL